MQKYYTDLDMNGTKVSNSTLTRWWMSSSNPRWLSTWHNTRVGLQFPSNNKVSVSWWLWISWEVNFDLWEARQMEWAVSDMWTYDIPIFVCKRYIVISKCFVRKDMDLWFLPTETFLFVFEDMSLFASIAAIVVLNCWLPIEKITADNCFVALATRFINVI